MTDKSGPTAIYAEEIFKILNVNPRRGYHMLEMGHIACARKIGRFWMTTREELTDLILGRLPPVPAPVAATRKPKVRRSPRRTPHEAHKPAQTERQATRESAPADADVA